MSKLIDLTGQRFGRLTVLHKDTERKTNSGSYWICQCDCGRIKSVKSSSLRRGEIQSCGCLRTERVMEAKEKNGTVDNLVGQRFGYLTVLEKDPQRSSSGQVKWICQCDCGNIISVRGSNLKRRDGNQTISCGCYHVPIGEVNIKKILDDNNIPYSQQQGFFDLPRKHFDFAILDSKSNIIRLIEFDGEQHFYATNRGWNTEENLQKTQQRDSEKNNYCKEHDIPLVRIPYWERYNMTLDMLLGDQYLVR